ncbi:MAG: AI-2E family transporter [Anaerolineales bacterium]|nr:AI-2E family transporter [Anaerolineales bacterium]MCB8967520.1 AI-2E family transporter [Ardenticatenaceae bacterium]
MSKSWSVPTRYFILTLILAGTIWLIIAAKDLIGPLAISALLAYVLNPIVTIVNTHTKLPRTLVVALVYLISLALLVGIGFLIVPTLPDQLAAASDEVTRIILQIEAGLLQITPITVLGFQISLEQLEANLPVLSTDFLRADMILELVQATTTNLGWIVVILVTTYYLLLDWAKLRTWVFNLAPLEYRTDMRRLYEEVKIVWGRYMRGQLLLMFLIGLMTGIGSAAIGLPGAVVFGLFAGLLDAILTIGPAMVMIAALLVALFAGSSYLDISNFWFMMVVLGLHMGIQGLENVWLRPRIMGQSLRLHPAVIFIGIVGALSLAGILAALIVIPVIGSVGVLARYIYAKILDVDPWGEDEEEREVEAETAVSTP